MLFHWIAYGRAGSPMKGFLRAEQGLTEHDTAPHLGEQPRPNAAEVADGETDPPDGLGVVNALLRLAGDRDVQPFSNTDVHRRDGRLPTHVHGANPEPRVSCKLRRWSTRRLYRASFMSRTSARRR